MPTETLFDLDDIDLNAVAVDADEVGRMNPQRDDMRQLDHVIWMSEDRMRMVGVKEVTDAEFWVPQHIPGRPLMPGVLMIEAAAQLLSIQFRFRSGSDRFLGFTRCDNTSFRGQIIPGDTLYLLCEEVDYRPRRMIGRAQGIVDGKLIFESTVTGMVLSPAEANA